MSNCEVKMGGKSPTLETAITEWANLIGTDRKNIDARWFTPNFNDIVNYRDSEESKKPLMTRIKDAALYLPAKAKESFNETVEAFRNYRKSESKTELKDLAKSGLKTIGYSLGTVLEALSLVGIAAAISGCGKDNLKYDSPTNTPPADNTQNPADNSYIIKAVATNAAGNIPAYFEIHLPDSCRITPKKISDQVGICGDNYAKPSTGTVLAKRDLDCLDDGFVNSSYAECMTNPVAQIYGANGEAVVSFELNNNDPNAPVNLDIIASSQGQAPAIQRINNLQKGTENFAGFFLYPATPEQCNAGDGYANVIVKVTDANGNPLENIHVGAYSDDSCTYFSKDKQDATPGFSGVEDRCKEASSTSATKSPSNKLRPMALNFNPNPSACPTEYADSDSGDCRDNGARDNTQFESCTEKFGEAYTDKNGIAIMTLPSNFTYRMVVGTTMLPSQNANNGYWEENALVNVINDLIATYKLNPKN